MTIKEGKLTIENSEDARSYMNAVIKGATASAPEDFPKEGLYLAALSLGMAFALAHPDFVRRLRELAYADADGQNISRFEALLVEALLVPISDGCPDWLKKTIEDIK